MIDNIRLENATCSSKKNKICNTCEEEKEDIKVVRLATITVLMCDNCLLELRKKLGIIKA